MESLMMKKVLAVLALVLAPAWCFAWDDHNTWELSPRYYDLNPYDGFFDPGTHNNPYVLKNPYHEYEIRSKYPDLNPYDGFFDPGTYSNPYVIKRR
jgi:hypothetical protein